MYKFWKQHVSRIVVYGHSLITVKLPGSIRGQISLAAWPDCTYISSPSKLRGLCCLFQNLLKSYIFLAQFLEIFADSKVQMTNRKYKKVQMFLCYCLAVFVGNQDSWHVISNVDEDWSVWQTRCLLSLQDCTICGRSQMLQCKWSQSYYCGVSYS